MIRVENRPPVVTAAKVESLNSAQRFDLHAKSSISSAESKGCLVTIWQGIKNVFNFLFGWIFRCFGAEKAKEKTFEPTAEFHTFYDEFIQLYYPHLDIDYFEDFETRKDLFMRVLGGEFHPMQRSKIAVLVQWIIDEKDLFITSEEEKNKFREQVIGLYNEYASFEFIPKSDQSAENILEELLNLDSFHYYFLTVEDFEKEREKVEKTLENYKLSDSVRIGVPVVHQFEVLAQVLSERDNAFYSYNDVLKQYLESDGEKSEDATKVKSYAFVTLKKLANTQDFNYYCFGCHNDIEECEEATFDVVIFEPDLRIYFPLFFDSDEDKQQFITAMKEGLEKK